MEVVEGLGGVLTSDLVQDDFAAWMGLKDI
jgi:hypothetical protein